LTTRILGHLLMQPHFISSNLHFHVFKLLWVSMEVLFSFFTFLH